MLTDYISATGKIYEDQFLRERFEMTLHMHERP